ncbi:hypothetical protein DYB26_015360 [Aphanomyces astaci]|uniref:DDE Tnp4 domain-containing protein n=1 Tax=Aphanomyces astaci TaxID=112090 RepID=A0A3R7CNW1_APHAT|nr:hypothetical protein DYB26_015360 [Aphanomyces astaci]
MHMLARKRVLTAINRLSFKKILHVPQPIPGCRHCFATLPSCGLNARSIDHGVDVLNGLQARRDARRHSHPTITMDDDEDYDSPSPVLDAFIKTRGPAVVHGLTNFSLSEINLVSKDLQSSEKSPTFSKRVNTFLAAIHPTLRAMYIDTVLDKYSMQHLHTSGHQFNNFPSALYAVDVTYRRTNVPAGSFNEKKRFYSKKHGQYVLKVEASVLPNGLAINVTTAVPGSVADIAICESNVDFHQDKLKKNGEEDDMLDDGPMQELYPRSWALLADKGYQGLHRQLRAITPMKRPAGGLLSAADMAVNDKIASDRVIVENFFGRLKTLWSVILDELLTMMNTIPDDSRWELHKGHIEARTDVGKGSVGSVQHTNITLHFGPHHFNRLKVRVMRRGEHNVMATGASHRHDHRVHAGR